MMFFMAKKDIKAELNENNLENVSGGGEIKFLRSTNENYKKGARFVAKAKYNGKEVTGYFNNKDVANVWIKNVEEDGIEPLENGHSYF